MAGKSFKGNLEVLNLSDIFQSLAMNRHSGTLIVNDGKREKKIFFAEGEITLLSTSRRQRLGDLLISGGKITEEDLELALKLQKQSRKKLGEILVEEGFCEEDDITRLLRMQVENELYDLFLWRKAEFEFLADQMPEDMAAESPNLTRLNINTNSLIMEALRRLDEWTLIQNLVPSTKEVFVVGDSGRFGDADVPDRIKGDPDTIDGKTNVEMLAEKYYMSEFDLCQHLAELVKVGAIRALSQEELAERAEAAYALNDFSGSAALYGRLAEYFPEEPKIMVPLADSMRRSGAEKQALALYEELATRLEADGRAPDRLRQCYEAITQLDPSRVDLSRKLENIDLQLASTSSRSMVFPVVVAVLLLAGGGAAFAFRDKLFPKEKQITGDSAELLEQAKRAETSGDWPTMHAKMLEIWENFPKSKEFDKVELPVLVRTVAPGYDVYVNDVYQGVTSPEKPQLPCMYGPATGVKVEVFHPDGKSRGEQPLQVEERDAKAFSKVEFVLYSKPVGSIIGEGRMDPGVAHVPAKGLYLAPSRDGLLRVLQLTERGLVSADAFDNKLRLGLQGDLFTQPVVDGDRVLVGTVDRGVVVIPCADGPKQVETPYPAEFRVGGRPLVAGGRVVFGTVAGQVLAYAPEGGEPAWTATTVGKLLFDPLGIPDAVVFVASDAKAYAFSLADGKPRWQTSLPEPAESNPASFGGRVLIPVRGGQVVSLDPQTGALQAEPFYAEPDKQRVALLAGGDVLYVSSANGHVRALEADGTPVWGEDFVRPSSKPPRLGLLGQRVVVAPDDPLVFVLDPKSGMILWQGRFPEGGDSQTLSPVSIAGDGFFVGTNKQFLHYFDPTKR